MCVRERGRGRERERTQARERGRESTRVHVFVCVCANSLYLNACALSDTNTVSTLSLSLSLSLSLFPSLCLSLPIPPYLLLSCSPSLFVFRLNYVWRLHIWMSHVAHMNESCHTHEQVKSQILMSHVTLWSFGQKYSLMLKSVFSFDTTRPRHRIWMSLICVTWPPHIC